MEHLKTFEGFFDFFRKKTEDQKIAENFLVRLERLKKHLEGGNISPYKLELDTENTEMGERYYTRYKIHFLDSPITLGEFKSDDKYYNGWSEETQKRWLDMGLVKKDAGLFYYLNLIQPNECLRIDIKLVIKIYNLAKFCYEKNNDNLRLKRIKDDINPAGDLLDDDVWGNLPIESR